MSWNSVIHCFLLSTAWTLADSATERRPQEQPPSYISQSQDASKKLFLSHVRKHVGVNQQIPSAADNELRVATFNVHFHQDIFEQNVNNKDVRGDLEEMQASIVIFQEVINDNSHERRAFNKMLSSIGYKYQEFAAVNSNTFVGNMIASKIPLKRLFLLMLGHERVLIGVEANFNGQKVAILGTHLEVGSHTQQEESEKIRTRQAIKIVEIIKNQVAPVYSHYLLAGDMNAIWNSQTISVFRQSGLLHEVFGAAKAQYPHYTCWAGTTIDFIFVSKKLAANVLGSYAYQTTSSDHLPVLVDFSKRWNRSRGKSDAMFKSQSLPLSKTATISVESNRVNWLKCGIISLSGLAILGIVSGVILYFVRKPSPPAKPESF